MTCPGSQQYFVADQGCEPRLMFWSALDYIDFYLNSLVKTERAVNPELEPREIKQREVICIYVTLREICQLNI